MARRDYETVRTGLAKVGANRANQRVPASTVRETRQETLESKVRRGADIGVRRTTGGTLNLGGGVNNL